MYLRFLATIGLILGIFVPAAALAQAPHPAELRALSDLRMARAILAHPFADAGVQSHLGTAAGLVDRAMGDVRAAAIDDGKPLDAHPPVDASLPPRDLLRKAYVLLQSAWHDLGQPEANPNAIAPLRRARRDITNSLFEIRAAARIHNWVLEQSY